MSPNLHHDLRSRLKHSVNFTISQTLNKLKIQYLPGEIKLLINETFDKTIGI